MTATIDPVTLIVYLASVVGATVAVLIFFDRRMDAKIEAKDAISTARADGRHEAVMIRLNGLIDRLHYAGLLNEKPTRSGNWHIVPPGDDQ